MKDFFFDKHKQLVIEDYDGQREVLSLDDTIKLSRFLYATACQDICEEMNNKTQDEKKTFLTRLVESVLKTKGD